MYIKSRSNTTKYINNSLQQLLKDKIKLCRFRIVQNEFTNKKKTIPNSF